MREYDPLQDREQRITTYLNSIAENFSTLPIPWHYDLAAWKRVCQLSNVNAFVIPLDRTHVLGLFGMAEMVMMMGEPESLARNMTSDIKVLIVYQDGLPLHAITITEEVNPQHIIEIFKQLPQSVRAKLGRKGLTQILSTLGIEIDQQVTWQLRSSHEEIKIKTELIKDILDDIGYVSLTRLWSYGYQDNHIDISINNLREEGINIINIRGLGYFIPEKVSEEESPAVLLKAETAKFAFEMDEGDIVAENENLQLAKLHSSDFIKEIGATPHRAYKLRISNQTIFLLLSEVETKVVEALCTAFGYVDFTMLDLYDAQSTQTTLHSAVNKLNESLTLYGLKITAGSVGYELVAGAREQYLTHLAAEYGTKYEIDQWRIDYLDIAEYQSDYNHPAFAPRIHNTSSRVMDVVVIKAPGVAPLFVEVTSLTKLIMQQILNCPNDIFAGENFSLEPYPRGSLLNAINALLDKIYKHFSLQLPYRFMKGRVAYFLPPFINPDKIPTYVDTRES